MWAAASEQQITKNELIIEAAFDDGPYRPTPACKVGVARTQPHKVLVHPRYKTLNQ